MVPEYPDDPAAALGILSHSVEEEQVQQEHQELHQPEHDVQGHLRQYWVISILIFTDTSTWTYNPNQLCHVSVVCASVMS